MTEDNRPTITYSPIILEQLGVTEDEFVKMSLEQIVTLATSKGFVIDHIGDSSMTPCDGNEPRSMQLNYNNLTEEYSGAVDLADASFKYNLPDPTPEMLNDPLFDAIWQAIKTWDINVPGAYAGYCGATGNHARAIFDAVIPNIRYKPQS